jgi:tetratricopeptide (TPR) repeat protein
VNQPAPAFAVPMAAGNFPQRVRDLHPLLTKFDPAELRPSGSQTPTPGLTGLRSWVAKNAATQSVLAAGLARLIGDFETAEKLLPAKQDREASAASELEANEKAALLWHRGECEAALAAWNGMADSPTVLFNRGMALLFLGRTADAKAALAKAVAALPETSGWNALARLYLAVAEIHG